MKAKKIFSFKFWSPLGKLHFAGWVLVTLANALIVLNEERRSRMIMFMVVVVLQHITLLLFMVDYEKLGREQWRKKEASLRNELEKTPDSSMA